MRARRCDPSSPPLILLVDPAGDRYGASRFTASLAEEAARSGLTVEIWVPFDRGIGGLVRSPRVTVRVVPLPVMRRSEWRDLPRALSASVSLLLNLSRLLRLAWSMRDRVAVVHAVGISSVAGMVISRISRAPLHWSVHETVQSARERRLSAAMLRTADKVYACSRFVAAQFPDQLMAVAYTGTHLVDADIPPTQPPMSTGGLPTILCVGRLNHWKGQDLLLRALAELKAGGSSFTCRIVGGSFAGDEDLLNQLRRQAVDSGLADAVVFEGEVADPVALFGSADVVVVPSKVPEPFGKVVVEAMALGRPVIATTPGGPAEVIESGVNGLLVPTGDVPALVTALRRLLEDPEYARALGRAAASRAREFSEAVTARRIAADLVSSDA